MLHLIIDGNSYHENARYGDELHISHCNCDEEEEDDIP